MPKTTTKRSLMPLLALLLLVVAGCRNPVQSNGHQQAVGVVITDLQDQEIARLQGGQWQGSPLALQLGQDLPVRIHFLNAAGGLFQLPHTGAAHTLRVEVANPGIATYQPQANHGIFRGVAQGATTANIMVRHGSHEDFIAQPPLGLTVAP